MNIGRPSEVESSGTFIWDLASLQLCSGEQLVTLGVGAVLSLGCSWTGVEHPALSFYAFADVQDDATFCMLPLWKNTNRIISEHLDRGEKVLVHCLQGQSRSVATVAAFLVQCRGRSIREALAMVRIARPEACINPGFLAQLYFISQYSPVRAEYRLLADQFQSYLAAPLLVSPIPLDSCDSSAKLVGAATLCCRKCKFTLCNVDDEVREIASAAAFVAAEVDDFWRDHWTHDISQRSKNIAHALTIPARGCVVVVPSSWMHQQQRASPAARGTLECPGCSHVVGNWARDCLDICAPVGLMCDGFTLLNKATRRCFK